jgi:group I intron endonuclease
MNFIVYKITCKTNNKIYIGQTNKTLEERLRKHFNFAFTEVERSKNHKFARAIRKYGKEAFYIEEIERVNSQEELDEREFYWINYYNAVEEGYNSRADKGKCGGDTLSQHWNKDEISEKLRASKVGDNNPMKTHGYLVSGERNGMYGKHGSDNPNSIECVAIHETTKEVKIFDSQKEASIYFGMKNQNPISARLHGRTKSSYKGWRFYRYEEYKQGQQTTESVDNEKDVIE